MPEKYPPLLPGRSVRKSPVPALPDQHHFKAISTRGFLRLRQSMSLSGHEAMLWLEKTRKS